MYTSNRGGQISLSVKGVDVTGPIDVLSTFVKDDTVAWRQWHHWNFSDHLAEIKLRKGENVLTLTTVAQGNMNYDYFEFTKVQ
ncbi:hypothetical protein JW935_27935 [candidate division KSB1 bacterium]|nr:hypothetical protein [candidate division KSB1 bacterium]